MINLSKQNQLTTTLLIDESFNSYIDMTFQTVKTNIFFNFINFVRDSRLTTFYKFHICREKTVIIKPHTHFEFTLVPRV